MGPTRWPLRCPRRNQSQSKARGKDLAGPTWSAHLMEQVGRRVPVPSPPRPGVFTLKLSSRKDPDKLEELRRQTKQPGEWQRGSEIRGFRAPFATVWEPPDISSSCLQDPCCCCSVAQLCLTLCHPMDWSKPGLPVPQHTLEFAQVHVLCIMDAIEPSHPLTPPSPSALDLPQHQGLFQWVVRTCILTKTVEWQNSSNLVMIWGSFGQGKTTHGFRTSQQHSLLTNAWQELHQP